MIPPPYSQISEGERIYEYENIFSGSQSNKESFDETMSLPIENALTGFNSTVFIYGMTGAGKTYTMFGKSPFSNSSESGLVSMAIDSMFSRIYSENNIQTEVGISFFEIYNENIRDLFQENSEPLMIM